MPHFIKVFLSGFNPNPPLLYQSLPLTGKAGKEIWCTQAEFNLFPTETEGQVCLFVGLCLWRWCQPGVSLLTSEHTVWCRWESSCTHALMQMNHLVLVCVCVYFMCINKYRWSLLAPISISAINLHCVETLEEIKQFRSPPLDPPHGHCAFHAALPSLQLLSPPQHLPFLTWCSGTWCCFYSLPSAFCFISMRSPCPVCLCPAPTWAHLHPRCSDSISALLGAVPSLIYIW